MSQSAQVSLPNVCQNVILMKKYKKCFSSNPFGKVKNSTNLLTTLAKGKHLRLYCIFFSEEEKKMFYNIDNNLVFYRPS